MDGHGRTNGHASSSAKPSIHVVESDSKAMPTTRPADMDDDGSDDQWESASLYEDTIEALATQKPPGAGPDVCTREECLALQQLYRTIGEDRFMEQTLDAGLFTAKKLCTAFGLFPPEMLEGAPDKAYEPLLDIAMSRWSEQRRKLKQYNTIDDAVALLKGSKNIMVLTGAGISTSLGIPDFRSKETGLYARLEHLGLDDPQQVFDIEIFREDPSIFYSVAKDIFPASTEFSPTHAFIRLLQDKGKLLTNFTQNIDDLESHAGLLSEKLIQCHGSFATATCQKCRAQVRVHDILSELRAGKVARCRVCQRRLERLGPLAMKRKRSATNVQSLSRKKRGEWEDESDDQEYEAQEAGVMKPDITFFGEALPSTFRNRLLDHDRDLVDLVIVIGTSLKVAPVAKIPSIVPPDVPQIFISLGPCKHIKFDIELLGECDTIVAELCKRAGWTLQHEMVKDDANVQVLPALGQESRWVIQAAEPRQILPLAHKPLGRGGKDVGGNLGQMPAVKNE